MIKTLNSWRPSRFLPGGDDGEPGNKRLMPVIGLTFKTLYRGCATSRLVSCVEYWINLELWVNLKYWMNIKYWINLELWINLEYWMNLGSWINIEYRMNFECWINLEYWMNLEPKYIPAIIMWKWNLNIMLLLANCGVHMAKYSDRSLDVRTEWNEVRTKRLNIFRMEQRIG